MPDLNRFLDHLKQATEARRREGIRGSYYLVPGTNQIRFIRSTPPKLPNVGPSNILVRTPSPFPAPDGARSHLPDNREE